MLPSILYLATCALCFSSYSWLKPCWCFFFQVSLVVWWCFAAWLRKKKRKNSVIPLITLCYVESLLKWDFPDIWYSPGPIKLWQCFLTFQYPLIVQKFTKLCWFLHLGYFNHVVTTQSTVHEREGFLILHVFYTYLK